MPPHPHFVERKVPIQVFYFAVDSRLRDRVLFPHPAHYVVDIPTPYKNVVKVELVHAVYETFSDERYVNLHVDELEGNLDSNNNAVKGIFTQLPLIHPVNHYTSNQFRSIRLFERPLGRLGRLTINFRSSDNSPFPMQEHALRFEIHCCKNAGSIENCGLDLFSDHVDVYVPAAAPPPPFFRDRR